MFWKDHPTKRQIYGDIPPLCTTVTQRCAVLLDTVTEMTLRSSVTYSSGDFLVQLGKEATYASRDARLQVEDLDKAMGDKPEWRVQLSFILTAFEG